MSVYVEPEDVEQVYQALLCYYREVDARQSHKAKEKPPRVIRQSSLHMPRNSLPLSSPTTILLCDEVKQEMVISTEKRLVSVDTEVMMNKQSSLPPPLSKSTSSEYLSTPVRGPKGTTGKLRRTVSGSLASLVGLFEK